ncbi:UNVERIFIED_CONTAM: hypothetical protein FKN15_031584 [Acipenser sinensis]
MGNSNSFQEISEVSDSKTPLELKGNCPLNGNKSNNNSNSNNNNNNNTEITDTAYTRTQHDRENHNPEQPSKTSNLKKSAVTNGILEDSKGELRTTIVSNGKTVQSTQEQRSTITSVTSCSPGVLSWKNAFQFWGAVEQQEKSSNNQRPSTKRQLSSESTQTIRVVKKSTVKKEKSGSVVQKEVYSEGAQSELERVRAIWILLCHNIQYDVSGYLGLSEKMCSPDQVIQAGKRVLWVLQNLSGDVEVGIKCMEVSGYGKGIGYRLGQSYQNKKSNHMWNAVQLGGHWYLLDSCWGAGTVDIESTTFIQCNLKKSAVTNGILEDSKGELRTTIVSNGKTVQSTQEQRSTITSVTSCSPGVLSWKNAFQFWGAVEQQEKSSNNQRPSTKRQLSSESTQTIRVVKKSTVKKEKSGSVVQKEVYSEGAQSELERVRAIWILLCHNIQYDVSGYLGLSEKMCSPDQVIQAGKRVLWVLQNLSGDVEVGIKCMEVSGYGKGIGYRLGQSYQNKKSNHMWNAVQLGGHWYLLDSCWGAGTVDIESTTFIQWWNALSPSLEELPENPFLSWGLHQTAKELGLRECSHGAETIVVDTRSFELIMWNTRPLTVLCELVHKELDPTLSKRCVASQIEQNKLTCRVLCPFRGYCHLSVFVSDFEGESSLQNSSNFLLKCTGPTINLNELFPPAFSTSCGPGIKAQKLGISNPSHAAPIITTQQGKCNITFHNSQDLEFTAVLEKEHNKSTKHPLDRHVLFTYMKPESTNSVSTRRQLPAKIAPMFVTTS